MRPIAMFGLVAATAIVAAIGADSARAHATGPSALFRTRIVSIAPASVPIDVRVTDGDQLRFENRGSKTLELCGYETDGCTTWVKIGPDGVFVDHHSEAYVTSADDPSAGAVPADAGSATPDFQLLRRAPAFYAYHDHRVHWMGGSALPGSIDSSDSSPQKVFDATVSFRYGGAPGTVHARLEYVGGQSWQQRNGEYLLIGAGIVVMLMVFVVDARHRRRPHAGVRAPGPATGEMEE